MKYLERYIIEELKLKPIGELSQSSIYVRDSCDLSGVDVIIDGQETGLFIADADYANWLEKKVEQYESAIHIETIESETQWCSKSPEVSISDPSVRLCH